jgi:hypothetical protein
MPAFVITGLPAVLIILGILGLLIIGLVTAVRASVRGAKQLGNGERDHRH